MAKRRRILEMWNRCAAVELEGVTPEVRVLAHHFFFAGAMGAYAALIEEARIGHGNALPDIDAELREHGESLERLAKQAGLEIGS